MEQNKQNSMTWHNTALEIVEILGNRDSDHIVVSIDIAEKIRWKERVDHLQSGNYTRGDGCNN